jgi:type II restriction/modification system DNA methylase subunit YeeA
MYPDSDLSAGWEYYVKDADRAPVRRKNVENITFLDPACGSGHFLLEAFDLFYQMYEAEGKYTDPATICKKILARNLYGIDIDERAVQIARRPSG